MAHRDMLGRSGLVTVEKALELMGDALPDAPAGTETVGLSEGLGRVLASDVAAACDVPAFARSSMDGFAVMAADTFGATESMPAYLELAGEVAMGEAAKVRVEKGKAVRISTGGMLPPGADSVVKLEHARQADEATLEVFTPCAPGEHVVGAGEDIKKGEALLDKGKRLKPHDIGALAGVGVTRLEVYKRPKVAVINTGNEIVPAEAKPGPGQVRDINSHNLAGLIEQAGGEAVHKGIIRDDKDAITAAVTQALEEADVVTISGGSSVGTKDLTAGIIDGQGPPGVIVHGVAVKPGKPTIIGFAGRKPLFGLPGHPVAVSVSFELFVLPAIKRLSGEIDPLAGLGVPAKRVVSARMARSFSAAPGRENRVRVALEKGEGGLLARPVLGKSGLITTLVRAHGTVIVPANKQGLEKGETVEVVLFD